MNWNLQDFGDTIEKQFHSIINDKISRYKDFWVKYVGNISGKPAPIIGISIKDDKLRILIGQWNYNILKNILLLQLLIENKYKNHKLKESHILYYDRDLLLSCHLYYNIIENFDKINNHIKENVVLNKTKDNKYERSNKDFINYRNVLTHNIRPLTKIKNNTYQVPVTWEYFTSHGKEEFIWSDLEKAEIQYCTLREHLEKILNESLTQFKLLIEEELSFFDKKSVGKIIDPPEPKGKGDSNGGFFTSGTTIDQG